MSAKPDVLVRVEALREAAQESHERFVASKDWSLADKADGRESALYDVLVILLAAPATSAREEPTGLREAARAVVSAADGHLTMTSHDHSKCLPWALDLLCAALSRDTAEPEAGLVPVREGSGGVLSDGTTNTPPIDFDADATLTRVRPEAGLDVDRVKRAVVNVAKRHGVAEDPPIPESVARIFGYSAAPAEMDAEIAAEYARLAPVDGKEPE